MKNSVRVNNKKAMMNRRRITMLVSCATVIITMAALVAMNFSNGETKEVLASVNNNIKNELNLDSSINITNPDNYIAYRNTAEDNESYIQSRMIDVFKNSIEYSNTGKQEALDRAQASMNQLRKMSESNMTQTCLSVYDFAYRYNNLSNDELEYAQVAVDQFVQDYECVFGSDIMDSIQFK